MNTKLLRKVQKHILAEPNRLLMGDWVQYKGEGQEQADDNHVQQPFAKCGTAACIAGWTCIIANERHVGPTKAAELLALSDEQESSLFYVTGWPVKYLAAYNDAKSPRGRARAAFRRIEHFIKTKGAE